MYENRLSINMPLEMMRYTTPQLDRDGYAYVYTAMYWMWLGRMVSVNRLTTLTVCLSSAQLIAKLMTSRILEWLINDVSNTCTRMFTGSARLITFMQIVAMSFCHMEFMKRSQFSLFRQCIHRFVYSSGSPLDHQLVTVLSTRRHCRQMQVPPHVVGQRENCDKLAFEERRKSVKRPNRPYETAKYKEYFGKGHYTTIQCGSPVAYAGKTKSWFWLVQTFLWRSKPITNSEIPWFFLYFLSFESKCDYRPFACQNEFLYVHTT